MADGMAGGLIGFAVFTDYNYRLNKHLFSGSNVYGPPLRFFSVSTSCYFKMDFMYGRDLEISRDLSV